MQADASKIVTEDLAYWFFRLNGCLSLVNFLVHGERRGHEGTDADIMAVRFPFRKELAFTGNPMKDHDYFESIGKIDMVIAEVKLGRCNLNGPWTKPERLNMQRVLYAIGAFEENRINDIAQKLYNEQYFEDDVFRFRLFAIGRYKNQDLKNPVVQITWEEIANFIYERFNDYHLFKTQHNQWPDIAKYLFDLAVFRDLDTDMFSSIVCNNLYAY
jgi:hypothetical protein